MDPSDRVTAVTVKIARPAPARQVILTAHGGTGRVAGYWTVVGPAVQDTGAGAPLTVTAWARDRWFPVGQ